MTAKGSKEFSMGAFATIFGFIISIVLSLIIASAGAKRQIGFGWSLFLGIWLTPIVSLIAVLLSDKLQLDEYGRIQKKWGCMSPFIVSFLIVGTVAYVIYSYSNKSKQRIKSHIELQVPEILTAEPPMPKIQNQRNRPQIEEEIAPEIIFDKPSNLAYDALTKKGTNPANEVEVDLNDFLGTPDDGTDWNSTELSETDCKSLARQKIYYSESKGAWVQEKPSNDNSESEAQKRREVMEREIKGLVILLNLSK